MPGAARHAAGLILAERGYRSVSGGPVLWRSSSRGAEAGGWSGYFVLDGAPDAIFDLTEWVDRSLRTPIVRYAYQVRFCNGLYAGAGWQFRLDLHPLGRAPAAVHHFHDHRVGEGEHAPQRNGSVVQLAEALPLLERHLFARIGACADRALGVRGRAPYEPGPGYGLR